MAFDLPASGQALKQAFADPTRAWWTLLALAAVPVLFAVSKALKRAAKGTLHRLKMWSSQPPAWAVELQFLREGLERLQRQQQENTEKLQADFEKSLAALKTDQQVHLVENLDTLHTAVKQGAQKVTLDGAQLQQINQGAADTGISRNSQGGCFAQGPPGRSEQAAEGAGDNAGWKPGAGSRSAARPTSRQQTGLRENQ